MFTSTSFSSNEDVAVVKCSLYLLKTVLDNVERLDVDSFMLIVKFVLCAVSKTILRDDIQKINQMVMHHFEEYLQKLNNRVFHSYTFDAYNRNRLKIQVQVQPILYIHKYYEFKY